MDFSDSPEEASFRLEVRSWLAENGVDLKATTPDELYTEPDIERCRAWQRKKADAGYAHIVWPQEYGGMGGSWMQAAIFDQEERRLPRPFNYFSVGVGQCLPTILAYGSEEQKQLIPQTLRGDLIWCQLFSEPNAGVDLAAVRTKAVKEGDAWCVTGQKVWTSGAQVADYGILLARTDPDLPKHKGLTFFIVDMRQPGVQIKPIRQISGHSEFNEVFLDSVELPDSRRLGEVNQGWQVAMHSLTTERFKRLNTRMPEMLSVLRVAEACEIDGEKAIERDDVRQYMASSLASRCALEHFMSRMLTVLSEGGELGSEASILKLMSCQLNQDLSAYTMDLFGEQGAVLDAQTHPIQEALYDAYLWTPGLRIAGGADEILMNIIAERTLGLPAGPRLDKGKAFNEL
ncbi:MAG: acyl-CoA dehydrogenase family protein [Pseudomonadota bacterium]